MATPTSKPTPARPAGPFTPSGSGNAGSPSQNNLASKAITRSPAAVRTRAGTLSRMEHSASQQGATPGSTTFRGGSSPAPHMMGTPSMSHGQGGVGLGMGGTPGSYNMVRGGSTGLGLAGMSTLGMVSDKELLAKEKIRLICHMFRKEWGYVSREGIKGAANRLKLDPLWETGEADDPGILNLAGEGVLLEIHFWNWWVTSVQLDISFPNQSVPENVKIADDRRGAEVLLKDLQGWKGEKEAGRYVKLRRFGENMEYLGAIDNFGKDGVNCFEVIDGVYRSFKTVEEWWNKQPKLPGSKDRFEMLTSGLGWPRMHGNGKVGFMLDYWLHNWFVKRKYEPQSYLVSSTDVDPSLYSMRIGVDAVDSTMSVIPVRLSTEWFEFLDDMPVDTDNSDTTLGAQFPPLQLRSRDVEPTYLPAAEEASGMEIDGQTLPKPLPHVLFKAWFEPPLPVAWNAAQALMAGREGIVAHTSGFNTQAYLRMACPDISSALDFDLTDFSGQAVTIKSAYADPETYEDVPMRYSLTGATDPAATSVAVSEFAFSHPNELLTVLPTLRMWAYLNGLFKASFGSEFGIIGSDADNGSDVAGVNGARPAPTGIQKARAQERKLRLNDLTPNEQRARIRAGLPLPPDIDSDDSDDDDDDDDAPAEKAAEDDLVEIAIDFPADDINRVHLDITIPFGDDTDPVVAFLALQPGPDIVVRDASEGDIWATSIAKRLLHFDDIRLLMSWVKREKKREMAKGRTS